MIEIVFLGTSASAPSIHRGLSAQVVMHKNYRFLVDCGEGTQRQILKSGLGFKRLNRILLTHGHLDHILGLGGLLSTFARWEAMERIEIYGGAWALERVYDLVFGVVLRGAKPAVDIELIEIKPGVILDDETFEVIAFPVIHRGPSLGYLFREKPRRPFLVKQAEALGVPSGPERGRLVAGEPVLLDNGRLIEPEEVLGPEKPGPSLVHVGDVGVTKDLKEYVAGVDMLVIEATYLQRDKDMAYRFGHATAAQVARLAQDAGAHQLVLTHVSRRYRESQIAREAQDIFPQTIVARDFDHYQVMRRDVRKCEMEREIEDDELEHPDEITT